jgi:hypothetical protein
MKDKALAACAALFFIGLGAYVYKWFHAAESDNKNDISYRRAEYMAEFCRTGDQEIMDNFKKEVCSDEDGLYCRMELSQLINQAISENRNNPEKLKNICRIAMKNGAMPHYQTMESAIESNYSVEVIDFLVKECLVSYRDDIGSRHDSALIYAIRVKNSEAALYFVREFPGLRQKVGADGKTPLELARKQGLAAVEKALK